MNENLKFEQHTLILAPVTKTYSKGCSSHNAVINVSGIKTLSS